jgi:hypothetical protein
MKKHITILFLMGTVLLLAGCSAFTTVQTVQPTPIVITSAPEIIVVTATPEPTLPPTETPLPTATPMATETALILPSATATTAPVVATNTEALPAYTATATTPPSSYDAKGSPISASGTIKITSIKDNNSGKAVITWTATGSQSQPFWIYYSESYQYPYYGGYPMWKVSDSAARSAYLEGEAGKTYWIRICHYTGSGCEYYSNPVQYSFPSATVTP